MTSVGFRAKYPAIGLWALLLAACSKLSSGPESRREPAPIEAAVAANFAIPIARIVERFEAETGHEVNVSTASTGTLSAQIENGAPFHVFLAADSERPLRLERLKLARPGSRFTYAVGRLALYGRALDNPAAGSENLRAAEVRHVAIANPKTAPYGSAAKQTLQSLGLWAQIETWIVQGENIAQTHQFVESGAADLGFVAFSQVVGQPRDRYWLVPETLHSPIRQDAVLLERGAEHAGARALLRYLRAKEAVAIIERAGYGVPPAESKSR